MVTIIAYLLMIHLTGDWLGWVIFITVLTDLVLLDTVEHWRNHKYSSGEYQPKTNKTEGKPPRKP